MNRFDPRVISASQTRSGSGFSTPLLVSLAKTKISAPIPRYFQTTRDLAVTPPARERLRSPVLRSSSATEDGSLGAKADHVIRSCLEATRIFPLPSETSPKRAATPKAFGVAGVAQPFLSNNSASGLNANATML